MSATSIRPPKPCLGNPSLPLFESNETFARKINHPLEDTLLTNHSSPDLILTADSAVKQRFFCPIHPNSSNFQKIEFFHHWTWSPLESHCPPRE